ncbi:MAG: hypothetical protein ACLGSA_15140 [Acidobacteriota bacterium]
MHWNLTDKQEVIECLIDARQNAQKLEFALRGKEKYKEADRIWEANQRLQVEIDTLIGRAMDEWGQNAQQILAQLNAAEKEIAEAVKKVKEEVEIVANAVKVVGVIDKIITILGPLLL